MHVRKVVFVLFDRATSPSEMKRSEIELSGEKENGACTERLASLRKNRANARERESEALERGPGEKERIRRNFYEKHHF